MQPVLLGAVDVGTSSIHLVIAEILPDGDFRILGRDKEMVQLGSGGFGQRRLTPRAIKEGLSTISRFMKMARLKGVTRIKAVATSAVREARNGGAFVKAVRDRLGLRLQVVSGEEEARLVYLAVRHAIDLGTHRNLLLDIGGGSLELVVGNREKLEAVFSLKLGALRLSELMLTSDPPTEKEFRELRRHIAESLRPVAKQLGDQPLTRAIGTSGAVQHLAGLCAHRRGVLEIEPSAQLKITRGELKPLMEELCALTREERAEVPGMDSRRIDTVLPAGIVLQSLMRTLGLSEVESCDMGLREGIILDHMASQKSLFHERALWPEPRTRSVRQLAQRCGYHRAHAEQVAKLALSLFDQLQSIHKMEPWHREMLSHACLLHDVGYSISQRGHHKHSYYLIRNGNLYGFSEEEIEVIANIARYHRKGRPKKSDFSYRNLPEGHRPAVRKLVALLRLANALDRTHYSVVDSVRCQRNGRRIRVDVHTRQDAELELWTARRQAALFERELDAGVQLKLVNGRGR